MPTIRLYGDISTKHEEKFLFIKGCLAAKSNGEALEAIIDRIEPVIRKESNKRKGPKA